MSWQLSHLGSPTSLRASPLLLNSSVLSVQKLLEAFAGFLSPHLAAYLAAACRLAAAFGQDDDEVGREQKKVFRFSLG